MGIVLLGTVGDSGRYSVGRRVKQGSVLSSVLFYWLLLKNLQAGVLSVNDYYNYAGGFLHADDIMYMCMLHWVGRWKGRLLW
jgi:hypothetical protein